MCKFKPGDPIVYYDQHENTVPAVVVSIGKHYIQIKMNSPRWNETVLRNVKPENCDLQEMEVS
jgi:hypothetical protein